MIVCRTAIAAFVLVCGACGATAATTTTTAPTTATGLVEMIAQDYLAVELAVTFCFVAELGEDSPAQVLDSTKGRIVEEMAKQGWDKDSSEGRAILELASEMMAEECPVMYAAALATADASIWDEGDLRLLADERVAKFCALIEGWGEPPDQVLEEIVEDLTYTVRDMPGHQAERLLDLFVDGIYISCPDAALAAIDKP